MARTKNDEKSSLRRSKSWEQWRQECYSYQYSRLKGRQIRLLELLPGKVSAAIKIRIKVVEFTNFTYRPAYEALSYVWGSATEDLAQIHVEGQIDTTLNITRNLALALPFLRYETEPRTLWIDAISINQRDVEECSQQVSKIYEIYRGASRVIVWLGEEANDSDIALRLFEDISASVEMDVRRQLVVFRIDADPMNRDCVRPCRKTSYAILHLLGRSWFSRLWVAQEVRAARSSAILMCGQRCVLWRSFCTGIFYIFNENTTLSLDACDRDTYYQRRRAVYMLVNMVQAELAMRDLDFFDIRCSTAHLRCTDPRDYIYALQGLLLPEKTMKPDYRKTVEQVYEDSTSHIIKVENSLRILTECDMIHCERYHPTWVPRFNVSSAPRGFEPSSLGPCLTPPSIASINEHALRLAGVLIEGVSKVTTVKSLFLKMQEVVDSLRGISSIEEFQSIYIAGGSVLEAWCRALIKNDFADSWSDPRIRRPKYEESLKELSHALHQENDQGVNSTPSWYLNHVNMHTSGRSLIVTDSGYCGIASQAVAPGDKICALLGLRRPMILRLAHGSHYKVVGPAYVHGLGDNEALIGPVPTSWKGISVINDEGHISRQIKDLSTGIITMHDPRLGKELPDGWTFVDHTVEGTYPKFRKKGTKRPTWEDPRTTFQALKERGTKLEYLTLI